MVSADVDSGCLRHRVNGEAGDGCCVVVARAQAGCSGVTEEAAPSLMLLAQLPPVAHLGLVLLALHLKLGWLHRQLGATVGPEAVTKDGRERCAQ